MADENMYEDQADMAPETPEEETQDESESKTALLPKEFFGSKDKSVGDVCKIRVKKIYESEVMVEYVEHDKSDDQSEGEMPATSGEMDVMMSDMG